MDCIHLYLLRAGVLSGEITSSTMLIPLKMLTWVLQLRSMKYVLLPENAAGGGGGSMQTVGRAQRNRRTQFLFGYAFIVQLILMAFLTHQEATGTVAGK